MPGVLLSHRGRIGIGAVVALVVVLVLVMMSAAPAHGPDAPYDHEGLSEVSVATERVVNGQASIVTDGLQSRGYWCVQPRSNDSSVQVACQSPEGDVLVDVIAARDGQILYADVDLGRARSPAAPTSPPESSERLWAVLDASFLKLWPQERTVIADLLEGSQPDDFMPFGTSAAPSDPRGQFSTHEVRTDNASWSLWSFYTGTPLALRVRTEGLQDRNWPFDGSHYATSLSAATTNLTADGFRCATSCYRAADDQTVVFDTHDAQIVSVSFTLHTRADGDRADDPSGRWVRDGLPFLTPAVRSAVGRRIEESRVEGKSWRGVVAGTPVQITEETGGSSTPDDRAAHDLTVVIGIPLLFVE